MSVEYTATDHEFRESDAYAQAKYTITLRWLLASIAASAASMVASALITNSPRRLSSAIGSVQYRSCLKSRVSSILAEARISTINSLAWPSP